MRLKRNKLDHNVKKKVIKQDSKHLRQTGSSSVKIKHYAVSVKLDVLYPSWLFEKHKTGFPLTPGAEEGVRKRELWF